MDSPAKDRPITDLDIRDALQRITGSRIFGNSKRLCRFLEFTVHSVLNGKGDELKETSIGVHVYDRKAAYEKSEDTIVRTEARRLRNKLKEYYATEGRTNPVAIQYRTGSYVPLFIRQENLGPELAEPSSSKEMPRTDAGLRTGVLTAVLPLIDLSGSSFSAKCASGLTEELSHGWMHVEGVHIISLEGPSSAPAASDAMERAQKQGVQIVLGGSVWEENQCLRVTIRVARPSGLLVWSQRFVAKADPPGLLILTTQLASALISRLRPELSAIRQQGHPISPELMAVIPVLYEAESLLEAGTMADLQLAQAKFEGVVRSLPDLARPHCGIANCCCVATLHGVAKPAAVVRQARNAAERALELDPEMSLAQTSLACVNLLEWKWAEANALFQRAVGAGRHVFASRQYALYFAALGYFDQAEYFIEQAQRIDPFSGRQKLVRSLIYYFMRRSEELEQTFSEVGSQAETMPAESRLVLAYDHVVHGRHEEARRVALGCRRSLGTQPGQMAIVAEILALAGDETQARHLVKVFKFFSPAPPISSYRQALLALSFGQVEDAWTYLAKAVEDREPGLLWLNVEPRLDSLRSDPRFAEMAEQVFPTD